MKALLLILTTALLSSCQSAPTKLIEEYKIPDWQIKKVNSLKKDFNLNPDATRIDARQYFLYKMSHIEGSYHMNPEDFFIKQSGDRFQLANRHFFQARRFSRYGINKEQPVIVFGQGQAGNGEEWLMALYFEYLGVKEVEAVSLAGQGLKETGRVPVMPKSMPTWKPRFQENLILKREELKRLKRLPNSQVLVIDTRDGNEYLSSEYQGLEDFKKLNIFWKEFIDENSRPNPEVFEKLVGLGVHPKKRILCVGERPSHSATACMALKRMGFLEAGIYLH